MTDINARPKLTQAGAHRILDAAIARAKAINVPQCIAIVDEGGHLLAFTRMDGAKFLSIDSCIAKAVTAASHRAPTGGAAADIETRLALAMKGRFTNLKGGLPILVDGHCVGGVGVGSGTGDQDLDCARAGIAALPGATQP